MQYVLTLFHSIVYVRAVSKSSSGQTTLFRILQVITHLVPSNSKSLLLSSRVALACCALIQTLTDRVLHLSREVPLYLKHAIGLLITDTAFLRQCRASTHDEYVSCADAACDIFGGWAFI
jgi:hypothetical protein